MLLQIVVLLLLSGVAGAAERPIPTDRLLLRDQTHPAGAALRFAADGVTALTPGSLADPRTSGATLEIVGSGSGDGATGVIPLSPALWSSLGPGAPAGFRYVDPQRASGIRRIEVRTGTPGGRVRILGGGAAWPYRVTQPQGVIDVRLTIGDDVYCGRLAGFASNLAGRVVALDQPAPAACTARVVRCGNHVAEASEDCDDGNTDDADGCTKDCTLTERAAVCAGAQSAFGDAIASELVTADLAAPTFLTAPPLDPHRVFVTEQEGRVRVIEDGVLRDDPFLSIEDDVLFSGERGLLSVAFHPDYANNRRFFVYYVDKQTRITIARYQALSGDPDHADPTSKRIVLRVPHPTFGNHNGGQLAFGPDGFLYAGTGDGGGSGDPFENAQDPTRMLGKLLRIDVDVEDPPYRAVPPGNPGLGHGKKLGLIWALGVRNPWRFSFDRATDDLYIADVGQDHVEEVDVQPASSTGGENYGWDVFEGSSCFEPTPPADMCPAHDGFVFPVLEYLHTEGCAVTGGYVYRGCALPALRGTYFYSDYCSSFVRTFRGVSGGVAQNLDDRSDELAPGGGRALNNVVSFGEDARGEVYILDQDGEVYRIVPGSR
jgi:cysteine-rich repeat protein